MRGTAFIKKIKKKLKKKKI